MAGSCRDPEEVGERGEADAAETAFQQAPGERGRAERRLRQAPTVQQEQLPLEEALVEASVMRNQEGNAREAEKAPKDDGNRSRSPQLLLAQPGETSDGVRERDS